MKSTLFLIPQLIISSISFSVKVGRSTITPGRFYYMLKLGNSMSTGNDCLNILDKLSHTQKLTMFLRSPIEQSFSIRQMTSPSLGWQLRTVNTKLPSATKMDCPVLTDVARVG